METDWKIFIPTNNFRFIHVTSEPPKPPISRSRVSILTAAMIHAILRFVIIKNTPFKVEFSFGLEMAKPNRTEIEKNEPKKPKPRKLK